MNTIEKNRNKQLAKNRQPKRGVLAKNVVVRNYTKKVRYDFDLNTQRLTIKANIRSTSSWRRILFCINSSWG